MSKQILIASLAALIVTVAVAGCGSSDKSSTATGTKGSAAAKPTDTGESDADKGDKGDEEEEAKSACKEPATSKPTGLPSSFPEPAQLTVTAVHKEGPTTEVEGYLSADFPEAYTSYGAAVTKAGYTVLHKERDPHDAEINYQGASRQGQIALKENCTEEGVTRVRITSRPA
jgi:hypothetical protein